MAFVPLAAGFTDNDGGAWRRRCAAVVANGRLREPSSQSLTGSQNVAARSDGRCRSLHRPVQMALKLVLEPIFEAGFFPDSHGFRPSQSTYDAPGESRAQIEPDIRRPFADPLCDRRGYQLPLRRQRSSRVGGARATPHQGPQGPAARARHPESRHHDRRR